MELNLLYVIPLVSALVALYVYLTRNNGFFRSYAIPCLPVKPLFGSSRSLMLKRVSFQDFVRRNYERFPGARVFGMFEMLTPLFVVRDPELIKRITVKDFDHFVNHRPMFHTDANNPASTVMFHKTLFVMTDQRWRDMRTTLSPTFTGSKMRQMFELIVECSTNMVEHYRQQQVTDGVAREYEIKDVFVRFTNDVIATCAFGIRVDSFRDDRNEFFRYGKEITNFSRPHVFLKMMGYQVFPYLMARLQVDLFDRKHVAFFTDVFRQSVTARERHGIVRPDMVHLLMQAGKGTLRYQPEPEREEPEGFATARESTPTGHGKAPATLTELEMVAQCLIFFVAGFDTIATAMTFLVYELAIAPDLQDRLYEEILGTHDALGGQALTYDALQRMRYMDMVVSETLRKWPPSPATDRVCTREYTLPAEGDQPGITIPKGANVSIPVAGLHHDPRYYPDPDRFDPERFSEENRSGIHPGAYLPFGIGPRNCIGSRFALMEVKAIVYQLLLSFRFERTDRTPVPMRLAKGFTTLKAESGVYLKLVARK
ncbi:probable cytochrome P450 9f2 isoform X2 [Anopheles cruzii]|uniref:probable cytochrome P450 9f2 isoform X2 n=1 Tax=Anopheles cruzii TaxID=68878 RepID=UPI0022EC80DD|nr:probable cytochrome P450 9f2 isoform X2 [Anopheles cruzii]